ncbi:phosphoglycolate phosphatase [Bradyrhizobium lablabi]|uniref:Phosphoglycolate phosphatase n=1 Tax=Bradyrhizobium lablabi TaxID=722472 RepID=A0A1M6QZF1_9BRAD|nr:HAD family hydrolase [Bradyrhizobium lablabi]SHK25649.1 phosphoglycolate phosphatase [Bradyrhizobium lablabi]
MDAIFFDLDGTLTDPRIGITRSIQYALAALDHPVPEEQDLLWCIGPPLLKSFRTMLGREALAERAVALYRERFSEIGIYENSVYYGIPDLLAALVGGPRLFVATSKPAIFAERIIAHFGMTSYFERVFGSGLDGAYAEKTELLKYALEQSGLDGRRAVMVGDRSFDMIGARHNQMTSVGVLYGYGSEAELRGAGAQHLCATPQDLRTLLDRLKGRD